MNARLVRSVTWFVALTLVAIAPNRSDAQTFVAKLGRGDKAFGGFAYACASEQGLTIRLTAGDTSFLLPLGSHRTGPDTLEIGPTAVRAVYMSSAGLITPDSGYLVLDGMKNRVVHGLVGMMYGDSLLAVAKFEAGYLGMWPDNDGLNCSRFFRDRYVRSRGWAKRYADAIVEGQVLVGMSPPMVRLALGPPTRVVRTESSRGLSERWLYGQSDFVELTNGRVSLIQYSQ